MVKKLSVAFVWHMHQPAYKDKLSGDYLMPWVRLHAIKDYLDMLFILDEFPNIKQTFNLVPLLLDQLQDYGKGAHDVHSRLTIKDVKTLTDKEKTFILNNFFDANYTNMIYPHEKYYELYKKRFAQEEVRIDDFSPQEYSDILAWFNLVWFDPMWYERSEKLQKLYFKGKGYTLEDRNTIIELQREIINIIIPAYKEYFKQGRIEISTSPYYHAILPLLIDFNSAKKESQSIILPKEKNISLYEDAKIQLVKSIEKFEELFGQKPKGIWPSEQCVGPKTLELMASLGIKWTISDEGVLSKTINKDFVRDFRGIIEDPYHLCHSFEVDTNENKINIVFRDSVLANLIGFEYGNHEPETAANDLYERIKMIQQKLEHSPDKHHLLTIALDGENSWESYREDGRPFLKSLYKLLSDDSTLDVTTVSNYIEYKIEKTKKLDTIHSGSWINRDFQLWIGDPIKNLAWDYLNKTRNDLILFLKTETHPHEIIEKAWEEIYIAEGSDWFWWYGEPNDSGQDELFDTLFRSHLQSVYKLLRKPIPKHLESPLEFFIGKPSKNPDGIITPQINGKIDAQNNKWAKAGCIELPEGPMHQGSKIIKKIFFCNDDDFLYFRFDINKMNLTMSKEDIHSHEIIVYFQIPDEKRFYSPIRTKLSGDIISPICKIPYSGELEIAINNGSICPPVLSEANESSLWKVNLHNSIKAVYDETYELAISFDDLKLPRGQEIDFIFLISRSQIVQEFIPHDKPIVIKRPM